MNDAAPTTGPDLESLDADDLLLMLVEAASSISKIADEVEAAFGRGRKHPAAVLVTPPQKILSNVPPRPVLAGIVLPTNILVPFRDLSKRIDKVLAAAEDLDPAPDEATEH